ncbi:Protein translocase subunit SecF [Desulfamplus magnetovallimortis]|uniref:Protein-export membrane protein SecF n=1 Tax=Desulfamplus magnetovallimortis TaxID=1246637 RepID=A0A1W1H6B1_9BACT|nr:protein translocase subunit SecF [Desulfamplus magnetovallimortis]SLM27908.1 Protein translocase subunit SecF [Desulfamplus magnetovallimortis]
MQFIKPDINIDFTGKRVKGFIFSISLIIISLVSLLFHGGPNYGIDFAGGTLIQVKFTQSVSVENIRNGLSTIGLENSSVQNFGKHGENEFLIRTSTPEMTGEGFSQSIKESLNSSTGFEPEIRRIEMVGPQVGQDLRKQALLAIFYSLLFITIYISGRFEMKWTLSGITAGAMMSAVYFLSAFNVSIPFVITAALAVSLVLFWYLNLKYAMGAIVALIHDIFITIGIFSIFGMEFSLPIIAALLTIIGYSLNDTIIVFDRIRENTTHSRKLSMEKIINRSINETLSRTILTSLTTLIVLFSLFFLGGDIIHDFAFAMITGVMIGTYSSIFVASPILLLTSRE